MKKSFFQYFKIAIAATYNWQKRFREIIMFEIDDIVIQNRYSESGIGPWKIAKNIDGTYFLLRNPLGEEITVEMMYIRKVDGLKTKAKW